MSSLTLLNETAYVAQFVVFNGDLITARVPGIAPGAQLQVPTDSTYQITATTIIDGNTYSTAPLDVSGAVSFLAQVKQNRQQGTYDFEVQMGPSTVADRMEFQKTTIGPVTFTIAKNGVPLQTVVVTNSFVTKTLKLSDTHAVYAVINGVTTDTVTTNDPNATVRALLDTSNLEFGYFTLSVD
ncbi:hypothetical protein [Trinickia acidisoli]|uniref:hypothetical protein n=1 Tax=Trinickia acidisoli TaxID=2767482 RepID=UPI001A8D37BD|nr:hypothetical protein [Trinickia acidisoli]